MPVPSYDDLAPSISDVHPRDTFDQVTQLVPTTAPVVTEHVGLRQAQADPELRRGVARSTCSTSHVARLRQGSGGQARRTSHVARELFACVRTSPANSGGLLALARDFSPRLERHGDACVVLDVSGLGRLLGDAHGISAELARAASERGLAARIAIAPTQTAALLLSLAGSVVVTADPEDALKPLPLATLRELATAWSLDETIFDVLKRWGIRAAGELAALPSDDVAARFGQQGVVIQRLARAIDTRPLVPDPGTPRFIQKIELEWPIEELEPLSFVFARMLEPLSGALERADRAAAAIRVDLRLVDRSVHSRMLQLPAAIRDPRVLRTLLLLDLESHPPSTGIDIVTIEIDPAPSRIVQYSLLERAVPSPETIATLTARLSALVGESRCGSPSLLDSYRPDAFHMQRFGVQGVQGVHGVPGVHGVHGVPGVLAVRRFRPPVAIRVAVEGGRPVHIANLRKGIPCGRVEQSAGPWRTSGAWWSATGEHWDRDEWDVALTDGTVCRIYRDRVTGRWFLDAVVD